MIKFALVALILGGTMTLASGQQAAPAKPAADTAPAAAPAQPAVQPAAAAAAAPAAAPTTEAKRVKMAALLAQGYEIKAVAVVAQEISSRLAEKPDRDGVLVTLQKGSTAATCLYSLFDYVQPGMLDIVWCIEQK